MLQYIRSLGLALLLSVGVGSGNTLSAQTASPSLQAHKLFQIANVLDLPQGDAKIPYNCNHAVATPKTQEGQIVRDKLWAVTSEETVGNYTFVSFVGKMEWLTINVCEVAESNIAVFQNGHLKFIIYTDPKDDHLIGSLDIVDGGVIRILSNNRPIAELSIREDTLSFEPVSQVQSFCDGSVLVPNIHGNSILEARQRLFTFGFRPQKINDNDPLYGAADLRTLGVTEVESCSPTGMAACQLNYFSEDDYLEVYTVGEYDREVNSYEIFCGS